MAKYLHNKFIHKGLKLRKEHPLLFLAACLGFILFLYYLIVLVPLNNMLAEREANLKKNLAELKWMARASHEISRLETLSSHGKQKTVESPFAYINQQVNDQAWSAMVTDVRQLDQNQVQINFKGIPYTTLMDWLQVVYQGSGIFVSEATLQRIDQGVVDALFVLRSHEPNTNANKSEAIVA